VAGVEGLLPSGTQYWNPPLFWHMKPGSAHALSLVQGGWHCKSAPQTPLSGQAPQGFVVVTTALPQAAVDNTKPTKQTSASSERRRFDPTIDDPLQNPNLLSVAGKRGACNENERVGCDLLCPGVYPNGLYSAKLGSNYRPLRLPAGAQKQPANQRA
jgi:hypothetical protein